MVIGAFVCPFYATYAGTLNVSDLWRSEFNDSDQSFEIKGHENGLVLSLILKAGRSPIIRLNCPADDIGQNSDIATLSIDDTSLILQKIVTLSNAQSLTYQSVIGSNSLKDFIHRLTSQKEAFIYVGERGTPLSLQGTTPAISAVLNYVTVNHVAGFPVPFEVEAVQEPVAQPAAPTASNESRLGPDQGKTETRQEQSDWGPGYIILLIIAFLLLYLFVYKVIVKPVMRRLRIRKAKRLCFEEIQNQAKILYIKRKQLLYKDDYGSNVYKYWDKEIEYFINSRIKPLLCDNNLIEYFYFLEDYVDEQIIHASIYYEPSSLEEEESLVTGSDAYHPNMSPHDYEEFCAKLLRRVGWEAQTTVASGDQGADVVASKNNIRLVIQCKLYAQPVGNKAVQEVNAARSHYVANYAVVVSNADYTRSARQLASSTNVKLLHHEELQQYVHSLEV